MADAFVADGFSEPISPELVLVSPKEFAQWARSQLPDRPGVGVASRARTKRIAGDAAVITVEPTTSERVGGQKGARSRLGPLAKAVGALAALVAVAIVGWGTLAPSNAQLPKLEPVPILADVASAPRVDSAVQSRGGDDVSQRRRPSDTGPDSAPVIRWHRDSRIPLYTVDIARVDSGSEEVVLTVVAVRPPLRVPESWQNAGHRRALTPGRYHWSVRAERVADRGARTEPLASGEFVVR